MPVRAVAPRKTTPTRTRAPQRPEQLFDTHPETSLDFELVRAAARERYDRPFLLIDSRIIREKTRRFVAAMPRVRPHYAVKANPDPRVLRVLIEERARFEIASTAELDLLLELGVPAAQVFYSNPMKSREWIGDAAAKGVEWFVVDAVEELRKMHAVRPQAQLYLRIDTPNIGADWPLAGKFGAHAAEIPELIAAAASLGANLAGVTFHVGSQCRNPENWRVGLEKARAVFDQMVAAGLEPRLLNIGGGFPVRHVKPIPSIEVIGEVVNRALEAFPPEIEVIAEPGRYLVSDAGYFVCRVVGTATRNGTRWMYWDAGLFGGIIETAEGLKYKLRTDRAGPDVKWTIAGPTCDSVDVILRDEELPADLQGGDFVYIRNAGAYTTAYASCFNGFPLPEVRLL
ncbi:MAG TPA: type III PLP-dependent enzyme [Burkholderiales bacterium]|nr:type III PLP-dependent enzyme [Burkholderiales bacterium]